MKILDKSPFKQKLDLNLSLIHIRIQYQLAQGPQKLFLSPITNVLLVMIHYILYIKEEKFPT